MKKEFMASVLTLTAGMATTITFPEYALAKSTHRIEAKYAQEFKLMLNAPARYTDSNGNVIFGHIFLKLDQTAVTPKDMNQLQGEMGGYFYFESDQAKDWNGTGDLFKMWVPLVGDDGESLLDMVDKTKFGGRTYQIYGCNSTISSCTSATYKITFGAKGEKSKPIFMDFQLPEDLNIEVYSSYQSWNSETNKAEIVKGWSRDGLSQMILSNIED